MLQSLKKVMVFVIALMLMTATVSAPICAATSNTKTELLSEKQRRTKYASKTNPAKGQKPTQQARPAYNEYLYADFGTYNSYASENKLGGTPIYLLGTIMDIVPFKDLGSTYELALMVNDCDGYQWYMRTDIAKSNLDLFKGNYLGKAAYIYGNYAGYSGVVNRPMMDAKIIIDISGVATDLSTYQNQQATPATNVVNTPVADTPHVTPPVEQTVNTAVVSNPGGFDFSKAVDKGPYMFNKNNGTVHKSSCGHGPEPENTVYFANLEDAINAGAKKPCGFCNPY